MSVGELPDIVFMDIELGDGDGIALVKKLFSGTGAQVIYVTSYVEYCTAVYETEHIYFLLKPVSDVDLRKALQKAHENLIGRDKKLLFESKSGKVCFTAGASLLRILMFVANITEKYDGRLETQQTDGEFETTAFIKV